MGERNDRESRAPAASRRTFLGWLSSVGLLGGLIAAYGGLAALFARYLYPARGPRKGWLFVRQTASFGPGESFSFQLPDGNPVQVTRLGHDTEPAEEFIALSSTCPHLGCQVHWEPQNSRFFCPCHNGVFTPEGQPVSGPPADAGQSLPRYPLEVRDGLLFIQAPLTQLAERKDGGSGCKDCPGCTKSRSRRA